MTKKELIASIASRTDQSQKVVDEIVSELTNAIICEVHQRGEISLPGLGKFIRKHRPSRKVRNPKTGEEMMSKAKNVPVFKASSNFKSKVA